MRGHFLSAAAAVAFIVAGGAQAADSWTLAGGESKVAYGSIKKNAIGEANHFGEVSGTVSADGAVKVDIALASVETWIDIRNERMIKHIFGGGPTATLTADIDMDEVAGLGVGETTLVDVSGALAFGGTSVDVSTEMFVARLGEDRVLVATDEMIMLSTEDLGVDAGVDKLMELAKLPSIARVAPVTLRLVFNRDLKKADAATADSAG